MSESHGDVEELATGRGNTQWWTALALIHGLAVTGDLDGYQLLRVPFAASRRIHRWQRRRAASKPGRQSPITVSVGFSRALCKVRPPAE